MKHSLSRPLRLSLAVLSLPLIAALALAELPRPSLTARNPSRGRVELRFVVLAADGVVQIERRVAGVRDCRWTLAVLQMSRSQMNGEPEFATFADTNLLWNCEYSYRLRWMRGTERSGWSDKVWVGRQ